MLKKFEGYKYGLECGDRVVIKYKYSKYYMQTGTIISHASVQPGDIKVMLDFSNEIITFYYTHLVKVLEIIEMPSGDVLYVPYDDAKDLAAIGVLNFEPSRNIYFFNEEDRWQIESYSI